MGFDKLAADLLGESVLIRSMRAMEACPEVAEIRVIVAPGAVDEITALVARSGISKFIEAVPGGVERHLSVWAGLERVPDDCPLVAVHDAARPLVSPEAISRCAAVAAAHGAAALAHRVVDTLKRANLDDEVATAVERENLWAMETPQIFTLSLLRKAYASVLERGMVVTDEVTAVKESGHSVKLVENREPNLKITVPSDLELAVAVLQIRQRRAREASGCGDGSDYGDGDVGDDG